MPVFLYFCSLLIWQSEGNGVSQFLSGLSMKDQVDLSLQSLMGELLLKAGVWLPLSRGFVSPVLWPAAQASPFCLGSLS